ncbi:hypothetical protein O181_011052 [Austropuccinia psidii MF-1]|uniref:Uncharacterized protein n=1 Tax=Austropuccinia psidii MF-1 TaxID=1389203 RepID=A0A9Q3BTT7_9BASI|nr:hypothetical protein [Austropuccinia psidii MF-1]
MIPAVSLALISLYRYPPIGSLLRSISSRPIVTVHVNSNFCRTSRIRYQLLLMGSPSYCATKQPYNKPTHNLTDASMLPSVPVVVTPNTFPSILLQSLGLIIDYILPFHVQAVHQFQF